MAISFLLCRYSTILPCADPTAGRERSERREGTAGACQENMGKETGDRVIDLSCRLQRQVRGEEEEPQHPNREQKKRGPIQTLTHLTLARITSWAVQSCPLI